MRYEIEQDTHTPNPRTEFEPVSKMVCFHRKYNLGDKHNFTSSMFSGWDELEQHLIEKEGAVIIEPLYLYDHSGITISTSPFSCQWDSGQVGFIYMTQKAIDYEWNGDMDKANSFMLAEVSEYDSFLRGDVYKYKIYDDNDEIVDTCGCFYGYNFAQEEAKRMMEYFEQETV